MTKPIIVIKAGRTEAAAKAAASHTGSLAGSDEVLDAAFRRVGVLRVDSISQVFDMAEVLAKQPRPRGPKLAIVTNAGGPGVLATDALIENRGELATLSSQSLEQLDAFLPAAWSHDNPIDILGDADPERYAQTLAVAAQDPNIDGLLVILTPQAMSDPTATARELQPYAKVAGKPVLASWMGGAAVEPGEQILDRAGIPTFAYPDTAAQAFTLMWRSYLQPPGPLRDAQPRRPHADAHRERPQPPQADRRRRREQGRTVLTEVESKQILAAYRNPDRRDPRRRDRGRSRRRRGRHRLPGRPQAPFPHDHPQDRRRRRAAQPLGCRRPSARAFRAIEQSVNERAGPGHFQGVSVQPMVKLDGYELIVGSSLDPQFGPVLLFGAGGQLVEVFKDRALGLPPLNTTLARRMMEQTKIFTALQGVRGRPPVDLAALEQLLVGFSHLVVEQRWIKEIDINPLLASPDRLAGPGRAGHRPRKDVRRSRPPTAGDPPLSDPVHHSLDRQRTERPFVLRPIRPEDEPLLVAFHGTLSERTVSLRYFHAMKLSTRVAHERLTRICFIDYDREMALVADSDEPADRRSRDPGRRPAVQDPGDRRGRVLALSSATTSSGRASAPQLLITPAPDRP